MGLLDHRKQWHFFVEATGEQCFQAFEQAMVRPGGLKLLVARWEVKRGEVSRILGAPPWLASVATYAGRAGIIGDPSGNSMQARASRWEVGKAIGYTQVTFAVNPKAAHGKTECVMWLSRASTFLGTTTDARFFRGSMSLVAKRLRELDPALMLDKS